MLPAKMVKASLSFVKGKFTQQPNLVLVPAGLKQFPVTVEWSMKTEENHVIGSHDPEDAHRWCVLDEDLKQVMRGTVERRRAGSKKAEPVISRTLLGGGAHNPRTDTFEFVGAKLRNGATYVLIASRHGVLAAGEFVAVHESRPKAAAKKKGAAKRKGAAKKKSAAKAAPKKLAAKAKPRPKAKKKPTAKKAAA